MRDPHRIEAITNLVERIWKFFPDMRYFQLMCNIESYMGMSGRSDMGQHTRFNVSDVTTEQALGDLLRQIKEAGGRWPE